MSADNPASVKLLGEWLADVAGGVVREACDPATSDDDAADLLEQLRRAVMLHRANYLSLGRGADVDDPDVAASDDVDGAD